MARRRPRRTIPGIEARLPTSELSAVTPPARDAGTCVVVGYDDSPAAVAAVRYAVGRAGPAGKIVVVHAFRPAGPGTSSPRALDERHARAQAVLDALVMEEGDVLLDSDFETEAVCGSPADAVLRVARERDADEIVVGTRGAGRARALLGSVSHELVHAADRPVVVVRE